MHIRASRDFSPTMCGCHARHASAGNLNKKQTGKYKLRIPLPCTLRQVRELQAEHWTNNFQVLPTNTNATAQDTPALLETGEGTPSKQCIFRLLETFRQQCVAATRGYQRRQVQQEGSGYPCLAYTASEGTSYQYKLAQDTPTLLETGEGTPSMQRAAGLLENTTIHQHMIATLQSSGYPCPAGDR